MKTFFAVLSVLLLSTVCSAGECVNGTCSLRQTTRQVVRTVTRPVRKVANSCANGVCKSRTVTVVR
jgi:hypothetical protein